MTVPSSGTGSSFPAPVANKTTIEPGRAGLEGVLYEPSSFKAAAWPKPDESNVKIPGTAPVTGIVCFRQGCVAPVPERHNSETVAPRHPVMPVANGLGSGFVGINGKQLRERNSHFPPVPADLHEHVVLARTVNGHA